MIRTTVMGILVCGVTIASGYVGATWKFGLDAAGPRDGKALGKMTSVKIKPVSIPIVEHGKVTGYLIAQFTFVSPPETLKGLTVKPDVFVLDAAFQAIYTGRALDLKSLSKESWSGLAALVKSSVNSRFGAEIIHDVVLEDFGYVAADQVRGGQKTVIEWAPGEGKRSKTKAGAH